MRVERLDHVVGRAFRRVLDPHAHVDEEQMAEPSLVLPALRNVGRLGETVVQVDPVAEALFPRLRDHLLGPGDVVADGLLAEHVAAGLERLHGGLVMVAAVLVAARRDAGNVGLQRPQHLLRIVERRHPQPGCGLVSPFLDDVAHTDQLGQGSGPIHVSVAVADRPHADDADSLHDNLDCDEFLDLRGPSACGWQDPVSIAPSARLIYLRSPACRRAAWAGSPMCRVS